MGDTVTWKKIVSLWVNKLKPFEQRIQALAHTFSRLDTLQIYLKTVIREMIKSADTFLYPSTIK